MPTFRFVTFPFMQQIITNAAESQYQSPHVLTMDDEVNPQAFVTK